jgi:hypothetical protein
MLGYFCPFLCERYEAIRDRRFLEGRYLVGERWLYVSHRVGGFFLGARLNCPPETTVLRLQTTLTSHLNSKATQCREINLMMWSTVEVVMGEQKVAKCPECQRVHHHFNHTQHWLALYNR